MDIERRCEKRQPLIDIQFTGLRPGEKLFEEILTAEEGTDASQHEKRKTAKSWERRAESREHRAKSGELRAESEEQRAKDS